MNDQRDQCLLKLCLKPFFDYPSKTEAVILLIVFYKRDYESKQLCVLIFKGGEDLGDCFDAELDEVEGILGLESGQQVDFMFW